MHFLPDLLKECGEKNAWTEATFNKRVAKRVLIRSRMTGRVNIKNTLALSFGGIKLSATAKQAGRDGPRKDGVFFDDP